LRFLPAIKKLIVSSYLTKDFSPIRNYVDLIEFGVEETKSTAVDLKFISEFKNLKKFYVDGMKKGLESISKLEYLETLTLRGIKLPDIEIIRNSKNIRELNLLYGSYKNLDAIAAQENLEELEISRTRQIPNYNFLNSLSNLKKIKFEGMSEICILPSLKGLISLRKIIIDNNSRLIDINTVKELKTIETFLLFFPENFKAEWRQRLLEQAIKIILESNTIKSANLWRHMDDKTRQILKTKGIEFWGYNPLYEKAFTK